MISGLVEQESSVYQGRLTVSDFETYRLYQEREMEPILLGFVKATSEKDEATLITLQIYHPPLVMLVPVDDRARSTSAGNGASNGKPRAATVVQQQKHFAVYARAALFDGERHDRMPIDWDGTRGAQKHLMKMLLADSRNQSIVVTEGAAVSFNENAIGDGEELFDIKPFEEDQIEDLQAIASAIDQDAELTILTEDQIQIVEEL